MTENNSVYKKKSVPRGTLFFLYTLQFRSIIWKPYRKNSRFFIKFVYPVQILISKVIIPTIPYHIIIRCQFKTTNKGL